MNKPKVDWEYITRKCEDRLPKASMFSFEQRVRFFKDMILEAQKRHASGKAGHKIKKPKVRNAVPPDLCCDDPYYDGNPVYDL